MKSLYVYNSYREAHQNSLELGNEINIASLEEGVGRVKTNIYDIVYFMIDKNILSSGNIKDFDENMKRFLRDLETYNLVHPYTLYL